MTARRNDKTPRRGEEAPPAKPVEDAGRTPSEARCWLCSRPLAAEPVKSMLGQSGPAVHQRCYEEALKS